MPKRNILNVLPLDQNSEIPLYKQIYGNIRRAILMGQISPGTKMPSTRSLSRSLDVSRNTVLNAYSQLIAEGCLVSEHGSGTYVAINLENPQIFVSQPALVKPERLVHSERMEELIKILPRTRKPMPACSGEKIRAFREGVPALDHFPYKIWQRLLGRAWRRCPPELLCGGSYSPLCESIAAYLNTARGVSCTANQVIVVAGSQMGISLVGQVLLNPGEAAWVEDPGYPGAYGALRSVSVNPIPVPLDQEGLSLQTGLKKCPDARLAFVTPSHQFPLGVMMSFRRRLELLNWAQQNDAWILEDDYDSEFRYHGRPLASLQAIDIKRRVIYMGTFSKSLYPALRLGYIVVPTDLVEVFKAARQFIVQYPPLLEQVALDEFIREGHFHHHIRRMRALYARRLEIMIQSVRGELGDLLEICPTESGMHLVGWLPERMDDQTAARRAELFGIDVVALSNYCFSEKLRPGLVLGFAGIDEEDIVTGVKNLKHALEY